MDLIKLPVEIQGYILSFMDTTSLMQCGRVCSLWEKLAQGCWQHCCMREISSEVLAEIIGCCQPVKKLLGPLGMTLTWESIFLRWNRHVVISKTPHQTFSLPFCNSNASNRCIVRLSGDFLVLAPTVEKVRVYKVHIYESGKCVGIVAKHSRPIQDVATMDVQRRGPYRPRGSCKLAEHDVVISVSLDRTLQINELWCHGRAPLKIWETGFACDCLDATVKVFGKTFVLATKDRNIFVWSVSHCPRKRPSVMVTSVAQLVSPISITHMNIWKDQVVCLWWSLSGVHLVAWDMVGRCWCKNLVIENILCGPNISTFRSLIFGIGSQLTILKNGQFFQKYDLWEKLGQSRLCVEKVTAVCLKRNLLVMGTQTGEIFVFVINDDCELRDLKSVSPVNVVRVSTGPMSQNALHHHLEIRNLDISFDGSGLQIVGQTSQAVHVVRWFPFDNTYKQRFEELPSLSCQVQEDSDSNDPDYWFYDSD